MTNFFDTSIRVPGMTDGTVSAAVSDRVRKTLRANGMNGGPMQQSLTTGSQPTNTSMPKDRLVGWYGKILEGVKQRSRKLQRLARSVPPLLLAHKHSNA